MEVAQAHMRVNLLCIPHPHLWIKSLNKTILSRLQLFLFIIENLNKEQNR